MFAEPDHGRGRRGWIAAFAAAALLLAIGAWVLMSGGDTPAPSPGPRSTTAPDTPEEDNATAGASERPSPDDTTAAEPAAKAARAPAPTAAPAPAAPPAAPPSLRVTSDVPGAMVFLNRKYLGTTPLVSRDVTPGSHQLNVQVEGVEPVVQTIEVAETGETSITVAVQTVRLDARVPVVHKHGVGSCSGTLSASPAGLRYQTSHAQDSFTLPFAQLDTFAVDYLDKNLRIKQRGGRTWNFTTAGGSADPLLVFHREVEAARP